jgi:hypothetical protein
MRARKEPGKGLRGMPSKEMPLKELRRIILVKRSAAR